MTIYTDKELHNRLEDWADWSRSPMPGANPGVVGYLKERLDIGVDSITMTPEIEITERAVARTFMEDKAYRRVIKRYYLGRLSTCEIASQFYVSESGINDLLAEAKSHIHQHILDIEAAAAVDPCLRRRLI